MSRGPRPFLADPAARSSRSRSSSRRSRSRPRPRRTTPASTYALDATVTPHATSAPNALFGASLAASDGFLAALVNATAAEIFSVSPSGVVQTSSALLVAPDPDDVGDTLSRHGHHFAMADGVVVLGTPAKHLATGGAVAWTHDPTTGEWTGPASLGSSDGVRGGMGYAVATSGGAVIVLGAPTRAGAGGAARLHEIIRDDDDDEPVDGGATSREPRRIHRGRRVRRGRRGAPGRGRRGKRMDHRRRARRQRGRGRGARLRARLRTAGGFRRARLDARPGVDPVGRLRAGRVRRVDRGR